MIQSRGYSAAKYTTLLSAYYNKPTPLQVASYGVYMLGLVRDANVQRLQQVMDLGLSPNACNTYGESILHNICRRGDAQMLDVLLQAGCEIQVSDDNGRTPLHDACWAAETNFPLIEKLLERDIRLLHLADNRGHLPLSYASQDHWSEWLQFLESKKDIYWPRILSSETSAPPELTLSMPHSRPIPNPDNAISLGLARMVAGGKLKPKEAYFLKCDGKKEEVVPKVEAAMANDDDSTIHDSDDDSNDDSTSESGSSNNDYHSSWNFDEMNDVLERISRPNGRPLAW
jgi:Ankyrin repeats (3 copies)